MDPVGTVRREEHEDGHTIWARIDPGYPDRELTGTEWTCVWSTVPGHLGDRLEDETAREFTLVGAIPGTPAFTGEDVEVGDLVETLPGALPWTDDPVRGRVVYQRRPVGDAWPRPCCRIEFEQPQSDSSNTWTTRALERIRFRLVEDDE